MKTHTQSSTLKMNLNETRKNRKERKSGREKSLNENAGYLNTILGMHIS